MNPQSWTSEDIRQMKNLRLKPAEAGRQREFFLRPPSPALIDRPATLGDGVRKLTAAQIKSALRKYRAARKGGRFLKFVPASGAASRMFETLTRHLQSFSRPQEIDAPPTLGASEMKRIREFLDSIEKLPFAEELRVLLSGKRFSPTSSKEAGNDKEILEGLLSPAGLDYARKPKGLVLFHRYGSERRTPLEEQLVEAACYARDRKNICRIHFTVSEEHLGAFKKFLKSTARNYEKRYGVKYKVGISTQSASTNTLAVDAQNNPFRSPEGRLVFRPGGHGALLGNLNRLGGDLVYIKNIDNVTVESRLKTTVQWKEILGGLLAVTQEKIHQCMRQLQKGRLPEKELDRIAEFAASELHLPLDAGFKKMKPAQKAAFLKKVMDRPLRVCGVVPSRGEPGGGPFWVTGKDGMKTLQIVESAQIDLTQSRQKALFEKSTHFNPVDLVCAVRNWKGKPYDLRKFVDHGAVFISRKSFQGRELKALELPGLWNGSMAHWITLFVEVPLETFNPVKTVFDLLKPAHQVKV